MTPEAVVIESLFNVVNKDGETVPFILNSAQRSIDDTMTGRDVIPKARQEGVSMYFLARYTAKCIINRNINAVIISHEGQATQRLLKRCLFMCENTRGPQPEMGRTSMNVLTFPKMNSQIYIGTAGAKSFGRGDTIHALHCSEYAFWSSPKDMLTGVMQAVPFSGEIAIESTGKGRGNDYHRRCMRAYNHQSQWKCHFLPWHTFEEYKTPLSDEEATHVLNNLMEEWEEPHLVNEVGLTAEQIIWRRSKLDEFDYDLKLFKQEYPLTIDECFQASDSSFFPLVNFVPTNKWRDEGNYLWKLEGHPKKEFHYVIGGDPAGGTGGDNSCAQVICLETMEQVAEYAHNRIDPYVFGEHLYDLATLFNGAYIVVESNNHGPITLKSLKDKEYPSFLMYHMNSGAADYEDPALMEMGFRTTVRTKPIMLGELKTLLVRDLKIHSPALSDELSTFIEHENGKLAADEGCMDDRVMALACAAMGINKAMTALVPPKPIYSPLDDPMSVESIMKELHGRNNDFPIRDQHAGADL